VEGGERKKAIAIGSEMAGPDFICTFEKKYGLSTRFVANPLMA
jgi:hypothetical protein